MCDLRSGPVLSTRIRSGVALASSYDEAGVEVACSRKSQHVIQVGIGHITSDVDAVYRPKLMLAVLYNVLAFSWAPTRC